MRPYTILTITVGLREVVALSSSVSPLISWSWWCKGWLRRPHLARAHQDAVKMLHSEIGAVKGPVPQKPDPPQGFACELAVVMGFGTPDEWRRVRWRDAVYAVSIRHWMNAAKEDRAPPARVGRASAGARSGP